MPDQNLANEKGRALGKHDDAFPCAERLGCVCKTYMCEKVILKSSLYPSDNVKYYVMVF